MILLGVTGSIAAYKAVEILRRLTKAGEDVHVIMTEAATKFVGPLTFQALSGHAVVTQTLEPQGWNMAPAPRFGEEAGAIDKTIGIRPIVSMAHLDLPEKAAAFVVAPASAAILAQLAHGAADDVISCSALALPRTPSGKLKIPVFIAPAMHESMWLHPATQANVKMLKRYGYQLIGPERGALGRTGDAGEGRMTEPQEIVSQVLKNLAR